MFPTRIGSVRRGAAQFSNEISSPVVDWRRFSTHELHTGAAGTGIDGGREGEGEERGSFGSKLGAGAGGWWCLAFLVYRLCVLERHTFCVLERRTRDSVCRSGWGHDE